MDTIFQDSISELKIKLTTDLAEITAMENTEPVWYKEKPLFKKKHGRQRFVNSGIPTKTVGLYRIIYKPTGKTLYIGRSKDVASRIGRHRLIFVNKGKDRKNPGGTTNPSAIGQNMYKFDTHRKHWFYNWCGIENNQLTKKYEDLLIKVENPIFNDSNLGGI